MTDQQGGPPFTFDFRSRTPPPPVDEVVEQIWYARGTVPYVRERIAPTGSTVGIVVLGDPIRQVPANGTGTPFEAVTGVLIGPHDGPLVNEPLGETFAVGIVTTAVGAEAVFGVQPKQLKGRVTDLVDTWSPAGGLRQRLLATPDPDQMLVVTERLLCDHHTGLAASAIRVRAALALLEADPTRPITEVAAAVGVSHEHLIREFTRVVGLTPRVLARLLRMRRLLADLDVRNGVAWADVAVDLGWTDQAHLIRDFKRHTGVTPTAYLRAQRVYEPADPGAGAGFVPEA